MGSCGTKISLCPDGARRNYGRRGGRKFSAGKGTIWAEAELKIGGKNLGWKRISVRENQEYRNYGSYRCR